jgi:hypothetical protein
MPKVLEIGWEIALNSEKPNAFRNPKRWIIPCITITIDKAIRIFFT